MEQPINSVLRHGVSVVAESLFSSTRDEHSNEDANDVDSVAVIDEDDNKHMLDDVDQEPTPAVTTADNKSSLQFTKEHETKIQEHDNAIQELSRKSIPSKPDIEPPLPAVPVDRPVAFSAAFSRDTSGVVFSGDFARFM